MRTPTCVPASRAGSRTPPPPCAQRENAHAAVLMVIADHSREPTPTEDTEFADKVLTAPLGEILTHEPSGVTFRTEES
ncbi:hypothetical protein [Streptomyces sp. NPDC048392]|uniref:hypothetical protein n=1 Tax=Streptomyces sp. NPDC048392 TaxID=3365543 RepID=UPI003710A8F9